MRLTLAKKIGGGFLFLLVCTGIMASLSIDVMKRAGEVSESTALDCIPKLMQFNSSVGNLLQGAYHTRVFFENGDQESYKRGLEYIRALEQNFNEFVALNRQYADEQSSRFIETFKTLYGNYTQSSTDGYEIQNQAEQATRLMQERAAFAVRTLGTLMDTMSATLRAFLADGNTQAVEQYSRNMAAVAALTRRLQDAERDLLQTARGKDAEALARQVTALEVLCKDFPSLRAHLLRQECRAMFDDVEKALAAFAEQARLMSRLQTGRMEADAVRVRSYNQLHTEISETSQHLSRRAIADVTRTHSSLQTSQHVTLLASLSLLILGALAAFVITRAVTRPLARTQEFAEAVARGNLDQTLNVRNSDETGRLADALRHMVQNLRQTITAANDKAAEARIATRQAQEATAQAEQAAQLAADAHKNGMIAAAETLEEHVNAMSTSSQELAAQIDQSREAAENSARNLQDVAASMQEMNASVQSVAHHAVTASEQSSLAREHAIEGKGMVLHSLQNARALHSLSLKLKDNMTTLQEKTDAITLVMEVISDIADQTNLLALNAAIEAARAGDAGRGFAVVADEVRKLAEKTTTSTADVERVISGIGASMKESMEAVDTAVSQIENSAALAEKAEGALEAIAEEAENTATALHSIATAGEQQSATSDSINRAIGELSALARQASDALRQSAQEVAGLADQSRELDALVDRMKQGG